MVAQQKKSAEKPLRMSTEFSAQERNTLFSLKVKITEKMETDEADTYLHLTTAQFIVKNGWEKFNVQFMKTLLVASQKLLV